MEWWCGHILKVCGVICWLFQFYQQYENKNRMRVNAQPPQLSLVWIFIDYGFRLSHLCRAALHEYFNSIKLAPSRRHAFYTLRTMQQVGYAISTSRSPNLHAHISHIFLFSFLFFSCSHFAFIWFDLCTASVIGSISGSDWYFGIWASGLCTQSIYTVYHRYRRKRCASLYIM